MNQAAEQQPFGGKNPKPTVAMKRFLVHMQEAGGWTCDDPVRVSARTITTAERLGWARVERFASGMPCAAVITPLGVAAYTWGHARVVDQG